jgi:3-hydroxybutyrate dehydrogenase/3-oxoacyl-[acyl-carrier protein] reductase
MTDEGWLGTLDWNLNSTFFTTRRALPHMMGNSWGRVINISSVESKTTNKPAVGPYIVTKAAINAFTRVVALEYAAYGITSNAICPGAIETDIMKEGGAQAAAAAGITYEQFIENYAEESMIKRINTVEEVAAVAVLLASEVAGGITGSTYNVDGGTSPW